MLSELNAFLKKKQQKRTASKGAKRRHITTQEGGVEAHEHNLEHPVDVQVPQTYLNVVAPPSESETVPYPATTAFVNSDLKKPIKPTSPVTNYHRPTVVQNSRIIPENEHKLREALQQNEHLQQIY